jgi:hypothetical protein
MAGSLEDTVAQVLEQMNPEDRDTVRRIAPALMRLAFTEKGEFPVPLESYLALTGEVKQNVVTTKLVRFFHEGADYQKGQKVS